MQQQKNLISWLVLIMYLAVAFFLISAKRSSVLCTEVQIVVVDTTDNFFINQADILSALYDNVGVLKGMNIENINSAQIETFIDKLPSVKKSEVYATLNGVLTIEIEQRNPIIRIFSADGKSYYIDEQGTVMPLSETFTPRVLVANGFIKEKIPYATIRSVRADVETLAAGETSLLQNLYIMAKFINENDFWKAQIEQIYVTENNEFELVPKVGTHIIEFGGIDDYLEKFRKLKILYLEGFNNVGWNNYATVNLKYKGQVVCKKR